MVVGSGPSGCVTAMYLDRLGFQVSVVQPGQRHNRTVPHSGGGAAAGCSESEGMAAFLMPRGVNPLREVR